MQAQVFPVPDQLPETLRARRRRLLLSLPIACACLSSHAQAAHLADHLVITEVAYDAPTEPSGSATGEYIEIYNPTDSDISLNDGAVPGSASGSGSYFISDSPSNYFNVVKGKVTLSTTSDFIYQFPAGSVIPAHGTVIVASDATVFMSDHFSGDSTGFSSLPGSPQIFEATQDGSNDGVEDLVIQSNYSSTVSNNFSLTNGGESAILFYWDGESDLIQDVDIVVWKTTSASELTNKDVSASAGVDGPDADSTVSYYQNDLAQNSSVGPSASSSNVYSFQRKNIEEPNELDSGGNGISGHDESSEYWSTLPGSVANPTWVNEKFTPGMPLIYVDGVASDALSFFAPLAVSSADGPNGSGSPADYGADGTLTELYMQPIDSDFDRVPDSLYFMVRGSLFGEPDTLNTNAGFVLFDFDPGTGLGVTSISGSGSQLSDSVGVLDYQLTRAGFTLSGGGYSSVAFDGAAGIDESAPTSSATVGWRTWGTGGTYGTTSDFSYIGEYTDILFDGSINVLYPGASGTSYAAADGYEGAVEYSSITPSGQPSYIFAVAVSTAGNGSAASPNTLPESTGDNTGDYPQVIDNGVCIDTNTWTQVTYYVDADNDGYGGSTVKSYCGPVTTGVSLVSTDCDDDDSTSYPSGTEACDGADNDCDGQIDEGVESTYYVDGDGDGYGTDSDTQQACTAPDGYVSSADDCDDVDPDVNPAETELCDGIDNDCNEGTDESTDLTYYTLYADVDGDGYGAGDSSSDCEVPAGYSVVNTDCDDSDPASSPGASEACDGADNDCDGSVPSEEADDDGDAFRGCQEDCDDADPNTNPDATEICDGNDNNCDGSLPSNEADADGDGQSSCAGDCNDNDATINENASEVCDAKDNDCDLQFDEGVKTTYYRDADNDGYGGSSTLQACTQPVGYTTVTGDCADTDPAINPGKSEICDSKDNDCDGTVDDGVGTAYYLDSDGDGHGSDTSLTACSAPTGYVSSSDDCNDGDASIYPGATEVCDEKDNDCDDAVDDGATLTFYQDLDGDGHGTSAGTTQACSAPSGYAATSDDCNDADANTYPGASEACDGVDNNCNGLVDDGVVDSTYYADSDGDGYGDAAQSKVACAPPGGYVSNSTDCNDADDTIHPTAAEACDGVDNNCDGSVDEGLTSTFYADADDDGYGDAGVSQVACTTPDGYVSDNTDCDDGSASSHPGADEVCDTEDNDCDGQSDEGVTATYYQDQDADGHGSAATSTQACSLPAGYANSSDDCDDADGTAYPGAEELCDGIDNNCNGQFDEGAGDTTSYYLDADLDGYGTASVTAQACAKPAGYSDVSGDCDDNDASSYPGASESCDSRDNDCDGTVPDDELDQDGDGSSACEGDCDDDDAARNPSATEVCNGIDDDCNGDTDELVDGDGDGFAVCEADCDDDDPSINPEAAEVCDGIDNDCDVATDENVDFDADGYAACQGDCDDLDSSISPDGTEVCNDVDDDCDGTVDGGAAGDLDGDGYSAAACGGEDCDDSDPSIHPDATDTANDGIDQDCSGGDAVDADFDGYDSVEDCDDNNAEVHPAASESACGDGADNDCDGLTDAQDGDCSIGDTDTDGDGLTDTQESALGTNPNEVDTDGDGLKDGDEVYTYQTSPTEDDTDGDLVTDGDEVNFYGTDPNNGDTDGDGLSDSAEIYNSAEHTDPTEYDTDGDGLSDSIEVDAGCDLEADVHDTDGDGLSDGEESIDQDCVIDEGETDPLEADTDQDGLNDGIEVTVGTDPLSADTDEDGLSDYDEISVYDTDPTQADSDGDGLSDAEELLDFGTNPNEADSDSDGLSDSQELDDYGTDPVDPDTDGDGASDGDEVAAGTDPLSPDQSTGDDDTTTGDDDATSGDDDTTTGDDDATSGDDDATTGDDDTTTGDDDTTSGDDDTTTGDDDTTSGDDDTTTGDDDTTTGDDDTTSGDDDTTTGDDDTTTGDDDATGGDESGSDDSGSCSCSTPGGAHPLPAGTLLLGLFSGLLMLVRTRRR